MTISLTLLAGIGLLYIIFGINVGVIRGKTNTNIGVGEDHNLMLAIRAHGNLAEWAPIAVMLIGAMEYLGASKAMVASLAGAYFIARILQSVGILKEGEKPHPFRIAGALGNVVTIIWASVYVFLNAGAF